MQSPPDHEDEIKFAKALVNPEKDSRDKTLAKLRKYVASIKTFDDMEMLKLWKALYYTMWLSDKPLIQNELAQNLTELTHAFTTVELQLLYVRMFFRILMREWFHLDQYRVNKFYSLIRLMYRNTLSMALKVGWESETAAELISIVEDEVLTKKPNGVRFHIADIFLPELFNVTNGKIATKQFLVVMQPFFDSVLRLDDNNVYIERVYKEVLTKYATTYAAENASADPEETTPVFAAVNTKVLQKLIFDLAAEEDTPSVCRKKLYELHKVFAAATKSPFVTESVEALLAADATLTKSAVAAAAKKDKKKAAAAAVEAVAAVPVAAVVEEVKEVSKKEKKEKKAEKAAPVVEKIPEVAVEPTKKKKRPVSEEPVEEAVEVVKKKVKAAKTSESASVTEKAEKSDKQKEKKAKTESKDGEKVKSDKKAPAAAEAETAAAAAPKVDTPPPQYIASAKFAGRKAGYAFKKGASGLGYYWDAVQARKNARASVSTPSKSHTNNGARTPSAGSSSKHSAGSNGKRR